MASRTVNMAEHRKKEKCMEEDTDRGNPNSGELQE